MLKQNIGNTQHIVRTYGGGLMGILAVAYSATLGLFVSALMAFCALFLIGTGEIRWCPCIMFWKQR